MTPGILRPLAGGCLLAFALAARAEPVRERVSLDLGWRFAKGDPPGEGGALAYARLRDRFLETRDAFLGRPAPEATGAAPEAAYAEPGFDDSGWRRVDLPHDWGVEGDFDPGAPGATGRLPYAGVGWYRRHLPIPASEAGRRFCLQIDGAMSYASVWVNGRFAGGWPYGYASFQLDLTPYLRTGADNLLAVRLDNPPDSSRWYPGGGIYRNVWLVETGPVHLAHWGTAITTELVPPAASYAPGGAPRWGRTAAAAPAAGDVAKVTIRVTAENDGPAADPVLDYSTAIYRLDGQGRRVGEPVAHALPIRSDFPLVSSPGRPPARLRTSTVATFAIVPHPRLWSPDHPGLYAAVTTVREGGEVVDVRETPFGIRTLAFDPDRGFFLNGVHLKFRGVCDHHDLGALGAAIDVHALERQLAELKEMGCNAIRTSHNPPAPELLDLCDRMGFLVMDEAFDCWLKGKRPNDYHLLFADWHEADLRALVRRDRNHPSVVMWSVGNEVPDQVTPDGPRLARELVGIVHQEDPTRPATSACNYVQSADNGFGAELDVFGYNYRWQWYAHFRKAHPAQFLFGSETDSCVSSRGVYVFPVVENKLGGRTADWQVSSYDLYAAKWAFPPDREFRAEDEMPELGGQFVWTGWDYLGEPTPFGGDADPARSSYFGIIDLAGFPKDRFYLYQAHWRPDLPMAHLVPHWTWPGREGKVTPVFVYTSGDSAELFLNGRSLGWRRKGRDEYRLRWDDVVYEPGVLEVVAYKDGRRWAESEERTAGPPAAIRLEADRTVLPGGRATAFLTASVVDARGTVCPGAANPILFRVGGPARLVATDNGDPTCLVPFRSAERNAFHGLALAIVRSDEGGAGGRIAVTAESPGLEPARVDLDKAAAPPGG